MHPFGIDSKDTAPATRSGRQRSQSVGDGQEVLRLKRRSVQAASDTEDVLASMLQKAVRNSGNLVQRSLRLEVLEGAESLVSACQRDATVDASLPAFEIKLDEDNIIDRLPVQNRFGESMLCLQQGSFMGSMWLALRLCKASRMQHLRFCMAAVALINTGRKTGRSVAVQVQGISDLSDPDIVSLACSPLAMGTGQNARSWLHLADDLMELANLTLECKGAAKSPELLRWANRVTSPESAGDSRPRSAGMSKGKSGFWSAVPSSPSGGEPLPSNSEKKSFLDSAIDWLKRLRRPSFSSSFVQPLDSQFSGLVDQGGLTRVNSAANTSDLAIRPGSRSGRRSSHSKGSKGSSTAGSDDGEQRSSSNPRKDPHVRVGVAAPDRGVGSDSPSSSSCSSGSDRPAATMSSAAEVKTTRRRRSAPNVLFGESSSSSSSSSAPDFDGPKMSLSEFVRQQQAAGQSVPSKKSKTLSKSVARLHAKADALRMLPALPEDDSEFKRQISKGSNHSAGSSEKDDAAADDEPMAALPPGYLERRRKSTGTSDVL
eukprot:TRINITY_DN27774_c0_g4_i2.p1 TRINITY_DN27774_c0_g4~~TRINITY_DN27774_c0_g4_i2.p1  ORF type:complete len:543 (+),score=97.63 TRINITY_DN27774_c0_g4_i2:49-1677(+)